jgi:choline dehydrogenase
MMEGEGGGALIDLRVRAGRRLSVFRSYSYPYMDRPNLTVLSRALVTRLLFEGRRASGVEVVYEGESSPLRCGTGSGVIHGGHPNTESPDAIRHR